jgi:hypothetical protein
MALDPTDEFRIDETELTILLSCKLLNLKLMSELTFISPFAVNLKHQRNQLNQRKSAVQTVVVNIKLLTAFSG